jgi:hypothetical protein
MLIGYIGMGHKAKGCLISIDMVGAKGSEAICSVRPRLHEAGNAEGFRGEMRKVIKGVGRHDVRELRYKGRGRRDHIPGIGCSIGRV